MLVFGTTRAATFTVTGPGSLRDAIRNANSADPNAIGFNIPGASVQTIATAALRNSPARCHDHANAANFRADFNLDGAINSADATVVRGRWGNFIS